MKEKTQIKNVKKEEPKSSKEVVKKTSSTNKGKRIKKESLKERNKTLYYITYPFRFIGWVIMTIGICLWYYVISPITQFIKKYYKPICSSLVIFLLGISIIISINLSRINKDKINEYNEKLDNITQLLNEYKTQMDMYKDELDTYKQEQEDIQNETNERLDSLNKKVTSRSSSERTSTNTTTQPTSELQEYAHNLVINEYGWTEEDFTCLVNLWNRESGWNPNAHNSSSGAHGIPQSLPASKMASEGDDYYTNGETQIRWGLRLHKK